RDLEMFLELELLERRPGQRAVVAVAETPVVEDRHVRVEERDRHRLERPPEIGGKHRVDVAPPRPELERSVLRGIGQLTGQPPARIARVVERLVDHLEHGMILPVETWLAIASKRDVRDYAPTPIPPDVEQRILDAGRLSGSSRNTQRWEFVVVES